MTQSKLHSFLTVILLGVCPLIGAQTSEERLQQELENAKQINQQLVRLYETGKLAEGIALAKNTLKTQEKLLSENHESIGHTLFNLGSLYYANQQYLEAESPLKRALNIYETTYGQEDVRLEKLLVRLGWIQHFKNETSAAESYFIRNLALAEKNYPQENTNVEAALLTLGQFQEKSGKPEKAVPLYTRAVELQEKIYGSVSSQIVGTLEKCACLVAITRNPQGGKYFERAMLIHNQLSTGTISVSPFVIQGKATHREAPQYPPTAKSLRLTGSVIVKALVNEDGKVVQADKLCGPDLLAPGAVNAALKWRFTITSADGKPTKVNAFLTFNFKL